MSNTIRIYVADLAADNSGYLHGAWIDATAELENIQGQINALLASSSVEGAEEYAIHDHEGIDGYNLGEYEGIEAAHEIVLFIEEFPDFGGALFAKTNTRELQRLVTFLESLYEALWQLCLNGSRPILRQLRYSV